LGAGVEANAKIAKCKPIVMSVIQNVGKYRDINTVKKLKNRGKVLMLGRDNYK